MSEAPTSAGLPKTMESGVQNNTSRVSKQKFTDFINGSRSNVEFGSSAYNPFDPVGSQVLSVNFTKDKPIQKKSSFLQFPSKEEKKISVRDRQIEYSKSKKKLKGVGGEASIQKPNDTKLASGGMKRPD